MKKKRVADLTNEEYSCIHKNKWKRNVPRVKKYFAESGLEFDTSEPMAAILYRQLKIFDEDLLDEELTRGCFEDD